MEPKSYAKACAERGEDYADYVNYTIPVGPDGRYEITDVDFIGKGFYSKVFKGVDKQTNEKVVLK